MKKKESFDPALTNLLSEMRARFGAKRAAATNPYLKERYELAVDLTVLAASKLEDLPDLLETYLAKSVHQKLADDAEAGSRALVDKVQGLIDRLKKEKQPEARRLLDGELQSVLLKLRGKQAMVTALILNEGRPLPEEVQSLAAPLRLAVKPDHGLLKKEAGASSAELLVHLIPGAGGLLAATMALGRLADFEEKQDRTVDDHLNYLDAYTLALTRWCEATDELSERLRR